MAGNYSLNFCRIGENILLDYRFPGNSPGILTGMKKRLGSYGEAVSFVSNLLSQDLAGGKAKTMYLKSDNRDSILCMSTNGIRAMDNQEISELKRMLGEAIPEVEFTAEAAEHLPTV